MTTPAKPERPERMTEQEFLEHIRCSGYQPHRDAVEAEAFRARAHEEDGWTLAEALAGEWSHALGRWLGYREAAIRLALLFGDRFGAALCGYAWDCGSGQEPFGLRCAHCNVLLGEFRSDAEGMAAARAHVLACPKHPMREVEAERDDLSRANASLAKERNLAIEAHHNATAERDEAQTAQREAELQRDYARAALEIASTARDAAREEAERLRASKKRIAEGLTKLRAKVERGLNLAEYLRALNELEPDDANE